MTILRDTSPRECCSSPESWGMHSASSLSISQIAIRQSPSSSLIAGRYVEELHEQEQDSFKVSAGEEREITVPSNYGRIWSVNG